MKKAVFVFMAVWLFISCSNPVLKWIDTPAEKSTPSEEGDEEKGDGETGRIAGQRTDKEIISFTFGLGPEIENDLAIARSPDNTGKFPILIILSGEEPVDITNLTPTIIFIGESLEPGSKVVKDFSSPVIYTVTAKDGSSRRYEVKVYVKTNTSKDILRFTFDIGSGLAVEGIIDQEARTIRASVPAGTNTASLTAEITHTGWTVIDPYGTAHPQETFRFTDNFSGPVNWTVIDKESGSKIYTVTVDREKSDLREITSFNLGLPGEDDIIGGEPQPDGKYPILVIVPPLSPTPVAWQPHISYSGAAISPTEDASLIFTGSVPVTYTVAAENGSTRDYVVKLVTRDVASNNDPEITGFYITDPLTQGVVNQDAGTITLTVPAGTDLQFLRPEIYYKGISVSPGSGQPKDFTNPVSYMVRAYDGGILQTKTYEVLVGTIPVQPTVDTGTETAEVGVGPNNGGNYTVIVEFPVHIDIINNPVVNINYPDLIFPVNITENVYNETTTINDDTLVIINPPADPPAPPPPPLSPEASSAASIDAFYFTSPAVIGAIDILGGLGTDSSPIPIKVAVPYGTNLQNLEASIVFTGLRIEGVPGHSPLKDGSRSFQNPVNYVVTAENDTETIPNRKYYRVTVTREAPNTAAEITAFSFDKVPPVKVLISGVAHDDKYPIEITVPQGTPLTALTPVITHIGASIEKEPSPPGWSDSTGPGTVKAAAEDFSSPIEYTVTAQDSSYKKTYIVTVRAEQEENIEITGFYFTEPLAVGKINDAANVITVTVPSGTNRANLKPTVYFKGMALNPPSGTVNNFTSPASYTVTGVSGKTRTYSVVVTPTLSSSKDITRFRLTGVVNSGIIIGAVPDTDGLYPISVQVPSGTNLDSLAAEIVHTGVSISPEAESPGNFNFPREYTVKAEDNSVKIYKVMVHPADSGAKLITSLIFEAVPFTVGEGSIRVVASINQTDQTITAVVPNKADITSLKPVITYIGKSIKHTSASNPSTANPFTDDTGRNFAGSQTYTVEDQNGDSAGYTVTVTKQSAFTVDFEGDRDLEVITSNVFDPNTGFITVTVNTGNVAGPYEWYIDGVRQGVSGDTFSLNIGNGSFYPGRYELMVAGTKGGLRYTGKVYFVVAGGV